MVAAADLLKAVADDGPLTLDGLDAALAATTPDVDDGFWNALDQCIDEEYLGIVNPDATGQEARYALTARGRRRLRQPVVQDAFSRPGGTAA